MYVLLTNLTPSVFSCTASPNRVSVSTSPPGLETTLGQGPFASSSQVLQVRRYQRYTHSPCTNAHSAYPPTAYREYTATGELLDGVRRLSLQSLYSDYLRRRDTTRAPSTSVIPTGHRAEKDESQKMKLGARVTTAFRVLGTYKVSVAGQSPTVTEFDIFSFTADIVYFHIDLRPGGGDSRVGRRSKGHPLANISTMASCVSSIPHSQRVVIIRQPVGNRDIRSSWSMVVRSYAAGLSVNWRLLRLVHYLGLSMIMSRILYYFFCLV